MTRKILLCAAGVYGACVVATAQTAPDAALDQVRIDVVNERLPMAAAVTQVERRFGRVVTYEDVPHVAQSDLVDVTDEVAKVNPQTPRRLMPRGDTIRLAYTAKRATLDDQAGEALTQLVAAWNGGNHSGKFRVERVAGGYHVIPVARKGLGETTEPYVSPLDTRISLPTAERDAAETLVLVARAITDKSGRQVHPGQIPINLLMRTRVTIGAENQTAREVLWRLLQAIDPALSWQMTCEVGEDAWCGLQIHSIG